MSNIELLKQAARQVCEESGETWTDSDDDVFDDAQSIRFADVFAGLVVAKNCTVLREALTEIKNRIEDHPMYAPLTMEEECEVGGDTAELSYLVRVGDEALKETA